MKAIDPRFAGFASRNDPRFISKKDIEPNGYKRTKAQTKRESVSTDPYFRDSSEHILKGII